MKTKLEELKAAILAKHAQLTVLRDELEKLGEMVQELQDNAQNAADYCEEAANNLGYAVEELAEPEESDSIKEAILNALHPA